MSIPETQLTTWSYQGSVTLSSQTYQSIRSALTAPRTPLASRQCEVFLQGSYANDTNVYRDSDVDIVIASEATYYYDGSDLDGSTRASLESSTQPATYSFDQFKREVVEVLETAFGKANVTVGKRAIKIAGNANRRDADVVAAMEYRRYYETNGSPEFHRGICFFDTSGNKIVNYPKSHSRNMTVRHQATLNRLKPFVRVIKNMRNKMVTDGALKDGIAPSYFVEGLLYNVPTNLFKYRFEDSFIAVLNWLLETDRADFICPNERYYLIRDGIQVCWPPADCAAFLSAIVNQWNEW